MPKQVGSLRVLCDETVRIIPADPDKAPSVYTIARLLRVRQGSDTCASVVG